jgi:hypothetical protein
MASILEQLWRRSAARVAKTDNGLRLAGPSMSPAPRSAQPAACAWDRGPLPSPAPSVHRLAHIFLQDREADRIARRAKTLGG